MRHGRRQILLTQTIYAGNSTASNTTSSRPTRPTSTNTRNRPSTPTPSPPLADTDCADGDPAPGPLNPSLRKWEEVYTTIRPISPKRDAPRPNISLANTPS